jgi:hypothetical protein
MYQTPGVTSQKTEVFTVPAVTESDLMRTEGMKEIEKQGDEA